MNEESNNPLRSAVKQGLLGMLGAAEGSLAGWKEEKEEERVLDLIAEAELTRKAAKEARMRRSLPQGVAEAAADSGTADLESPEVSKWAQPEVLDKAFERKAAQAAKDAERLARKERNRARSDELAQRAKSVAFSAAASVSEAVILAVEGDEGDGQLPGQGVSAEARQPKPESRVRRLGRAVAGAARGVAAFAQQRRDDATRQAEADAQWARLEGLRSEMAMLGLEWSDVPPSDAAPSAGRSRKMSERRLRKAFRKRSRQLHPDLNPGSGRGAEEFGDIRDLNAAYERLRAAL